MAARTPVGALRRTTLPTPDVGFQPPVRETVNDSEPSVRMLLEQPRRAHSHACFTEPPLLPDLPLLRTAAWPPRRAASGRHCWPGQACAGRNLVQALPATAKDARRAHGHFPRATWL